MQITIQRALPGDAAILSAISRQTFFDTFTGTCTEEDMQSFLDTNFNLQQVERELSNNDDYYWLARAGDEVVGYLRLMEDYSQFPLIKQWKALELKRIYVLREFQGKGVAPLLMEHTINFARENNYQVVWLGVWEHNLRAQAFYRKQGFEDSGHTHDFPIGHTPQTDRWMWRFL
jgi:ribosomal protein S18 acetylase RimI-like enzyme